MSELTKEQMLNAVRVLKERPEPVIDSGYVWLLNLAEQSLNGLTKEEAKHLMDLMTDRRIAEPQCSICLSARAKLRRIAGEER